MKYLATLLTFALCGPAYSQHKKAISAGGTVYPTQGALSAGDAFFFWDASSNATTNLYFSNLQTTLWTDGVMVNSLRIPNAAAPVVDAFAEIAGDNNLWAASRGAMVFYDGTAPVAMVATLVSDVPTNGQVPTWNTGGTITWETPGAGGGLGDVTAAAAFGTDNVLVRSDGTGKGVQSSGIVISDANAMSGVASIAVTGDVSTPSILLNEGAAPATPAANKVTFYAKADGFIYGKDDAGTEKPLSNIGATQTNTHTSPVAGSPLAPTWTTDTHIVWMGATGEIDLPAAAGYAGRGLILYSTGTYIVTFDPNLSEVIVRDGTVQAAGISFTLSSGAGNYVALVSDGVRWVTLGFKGSLAVGS